jgi:hypothetical protein
MKIRVSILMWHECLCSPVTCTYASRGAGPHRITQATARTWWAGLYALITQRAVLGGIHSW